MTSAIATAAIPSMDTSPVVAVHPLMVVGFVGATASFGWFIAMTLQQAAIVKAVAQVEMLFSFATSVLVFKEKMTAAEALGCVLVVLGVLTLLLA